MNEKAKKLIKGVVVSDKMDKTVVVRIDRVKSHPIYKKSFVISKNVKASDEDNQYKDGDIVEIVEIRPLSKGKNFQVVKKVK